MQVLSKQNQTGGHFAGRNGEKSAKKLHIIGLGDLEGNQKKTQCFRVRADVFASAHGRPDGMPGRDIGARAKALREKQASKRGT